MRYVRLVLVPIILVACGGSSGEPLLSGSVSGTFKTTTFAIKDGLVGLANGATVIALSDSDFECSTLSQSSPPKGNYAAISVSNLAAGTYTGVQVTMFENNGSLDFLGSAAATLEITNVTANNLSATITYTDTIQGSAMALNGTFEVTRCP